MRKLGLLVMPFMIVPLLASCAKDGPVPKNTYTVTIGTVAHFNPSKTLFTFEEDDFNPIKFTYTTDPDYEITNFTIDPTESADCSYTANEITITPKVNANFTVTPNVVKPFIITPLPLTQVISIFTQKPPHYLLEKMYFKKLN